MTEEYIDIQRFEEIKKELNSLYARKSNVLWDEIPVELQDSVNNFITGKTMAVYQGQPSIHYSNFVDFFNFLWKR